MVVNTAPERDEIQRFIGDENITLVIIDTLDAYERPLGLATHVDHSLRKRRELCREGYEVWGC